MVQMALSEVLAKYRSVYNTFTTWAQLRKDVEADPYAGSTLAALVAELRAQGSFRKPVLLGRYEEWEYDFDADDESNDVLTAAYDAVLDGTKRLLAHVIVGNQEVEVQLIAAGESIPRETELDRYSVSTEVIVPLPLINRTHPELTLSGAKADEDKELDFWEALMSVRLNAEVWLTDQTSGSQRQGDEVRYSMVWDTTAFAVPKPLINNAVLARLRDLGFDVSRVRVHSKLEDWSGDAPVEVEQVDIRHLLAG